MTQVFNEDVFEYQRLETPEFGKAECVMDWRNYVPGSWIEHWEEFTEREKAVIAIMAEKRASTEEWD